jgi:flagellar hook-associated protein 2
MAVDISSVLTTSNIDSLVNSYISNETDKSITPITTRKTRYQNLSSAYATFSSKLSTLKTMLASFQINDTSSLFNAKSAASSNNDFVTASADNSASIGAFSLRVDQLAKNDVLLSQDLSSSSANAISGTHEFTIQSGDENGNIYTSNVEVTFSSSETNQTVMQKVRDAVNSDKAVVQSNVKTGTDSYSGGASSFVIDLNGTQTTISVNGGGTYSDLIDEIISQINSNVSGVAAEKVVDSPNPGDVQLKLTVTNSSDYISISNSSGFDLVSDLGIGATKEKGASGMVTASVFTPSTGNTQFSLTSKKTGVDYRIQNISDTGSYTALSSIGLNLGSSRPAFDQSTTPDTAGYLYSDISSNSLLNSKFTFNGININRDSNEISDLVTGVTFNLKSVMQASDSDVSISVANDVTSVESQVQDFIKKFNDIYQYLKTNTSISGGGALYADSNARSLLSTLGSIAFSKVSGIPANNLNNLSQIGISFDSSTGLSISDTTEFEQKVSENADQVAALFNSSNGIAVSLFNKVDPYLGSGGYLQISQNRYDDNVRTLSDQITATQNRINKSADNLRNQYEQLQAQLASLLTVQSMFGS